MKFRPVVYLLTGYVLTTVCGIPIVSQAKADEDVRFICASGYNQATNLRFPTTYAWTSRGKIAIIRWKYTWFYSKTVTPEQRCEQVSSRFQTAYNNKSLNYITNGTVNGQAVICTATQQDGACNTVLLTLRPEDDPLDILNELKEILNGRSTAPIQHSSKQRPVYYKLDIKKFLQTAPIEKE